MAKRRGPASHKPRSCVIIVENLPVPFDRRVWQEAQALKRAGWVVSVICPCSPKYPALRETIDGIAVYRHPLPPEGHGALSYFHEYSMALFHETRLLIQVYRERGFSIIQACNPPDLIFMTAMPFKLLGKRFVYDQHDVAPELFVVKYKRKGFLFKLLLRFERFSYAMADFVITANATFRDLAIERGGKDPKRVEVVYGVPDRSRIHRVDPDPGARGGRKFVIGYLGIINDQDGVDHFVQAAAELLRSGVSDFRAVVVGDGPALPAVRALATSLGLDDHVLFTGYLSGEPLLAHISAFDIGVIPDPYNEANDVMSMNKVFEYCALGIPTAAYPLRETQRLLGAAGCYATSFEPAGLADACLRLMLDRDVFAACAREAVRLSADTFVWEREAKKYVDAYERTLALI
ncbi:MAG: glycosyltransferase family 4 protein [Caulobacteraceae bacterium]|nr:glycosyltransferase family 4 protein [Caulobacteraceae bacterium]